MLWRFDVIVIAISVLAIKTLRELQCQQVWALIEQGTCIWQEMYCTAVTSTLNKATPYMATQRMVVNMQLAASGHYHDVKYPKYVYTELDTLPPYLLLVELLY